MNSTGFIRGYMSKGITSEKFIHHVAKTIEKELQEWNPNYKVFLMKLTNYELIINSREAITL